MPNIFLPDLMAVAGVKTNTLNLDKNIFDESKGIWTRKYTYPNLFQVLKKVFKLLRNILVLVMTRNLVLLH